MEFKTAFVIIVGGYGHVGTLIASHLSKSERYLITIAGRKENERLTGSTFLISMPLKKVIHKRGFQPT